MATSTFGYSCPKVTFYVHHLHVAYLEGILPCMWFKAGGKNMELELVVSKLTLKLLMTIPKIFVESGAQIIRQTSLKHQIVIDFALKS